MLQKVNWKSAQVREIVVQEINSGPGNLQNAFRKIASAVGCKPATVNAAYYGGLKYELKDLLKVSTTTKQTENNSKNVIMKSVKGTLIHEKMISSVKESGFLIETVTRIYTI